MIWAFAAGFFFHTSKEGAEVLGRYSLEYVLELAIVILTATGLSAAAFFVAGERRITRGDEETVLPLRAKLAIVGATVLVALAAGEIVLALRWKHELERRRRSLAEFHPFLQAVPVRGDPNLVVNRWGFRGEEIERKKPPGTYRVFMVGGSTVLCPYVSFEASHPRLLEKKLREAYRGVRVEVQNGGMEWHTSEHALIRFLFEIQDFEPDLIIAYHGINDLARSFSPPGFARGGYRPDYGHYEGPVARMVDTYAKGSDHIRLFVLSSVCSFVARDWLSDFRPGRAPRLVHWTRWESLPAYERNLRDFVGVVRAKGIDLVLASQPSLYRPDLGDAERYRLVFPTLFAHDEGEIPDIRSMMDGLRLFNRTTRAVAEAAGIPFVDLDARLPKTLEVFGDDVHTTEAGNRLIAEGFAQNCSTGN